MIVMLLTEYHLEFLSFKGGCTGSSESTLVKMPHCWKSHATAHIWSTFKKCRPRLESVVSYQDLHILCDFDIEDLTNVHECSCFIEFIKRVGEKR